MGERPSIALCMIVRDEAAVIERCVGSVRDLVDAWVVCDTGSTDDTPARVAAALDGVPGELHHHEWRDFGHNRTELMRAARGAADYLLLLDADMTLRCAAPVGPLDADAYLMRHEGSLDYSVPRLVRGDHPWRFEGVTHEYLASDEPFTTARLDALVVEHHADGGARHDKFERDRRLLEAELARVPDDPRTLFYLAQTWRDLGDVDRAIDLYRRRVAVGGWDEEQFYAQLQVGTLLIDRDWDQAVRELLAAWDLRPTRAEPLYELARGYRAREQHELARVIASRGLQIPYPDDLLFVHRDVHTWALRFERAISSYWTGHYEEALADNDALLALGLPGEIERWVRHNRDWCVRALGRADWPHVYGEPLVADALPVLADVAPSTRIDTLVIPGPEGWPLMNPTIATDGDGFRLVVRSVNYELSGHDYHVLDADGVVRTINHLVTTDGDLNITSVAMMPMVPAGPPVANGVVLGCEDCRLVELDGTWYATATVRDRNPGFVCETALLTLDGPEVTRLVVLESPNPSVHEKNWMPFVHDGALHLLYGCSPTVVLRCDVRTGALTRVSERAGPAVAQGFRGNTQGLRVDDGWLFLVHETAVVPDSSRTYAHRVVHLRDDFVLDAVSAPFTFTGPGVEFAAGLTARGGEALLSFGVADRIAAVARLPLAELLALVAGNPPPVSP